MRRCGFCEAELVGKRHDALYCDGICRRAAWAERTGYRRASAGNGRERLRSPHPGGLQVSYRKAVLAAAKLVHRLGPEPHHTIDLDWVPLAEEALREALSERQRERVR